MASKRMDAGRGGRPDVVKQARGKQSRRGFYLTLLVVGIAGVAGILWATQRSKTASIVTVPTPAANLAAAPGYLRGSPTAPVEIVEYADFECPGCGQFSTVTEPDVRTNLVNTGKIRMRYIDYPLPMHRNTWDASLAAACANDQGKFWELHDVIFANQDRWNGEATSRPRPVLADLAKGVGVDIDKYDDCMKADTHRAKVQSHLQEAERRQVTQTPTFIIGGNQIPGAIPYDTFKKLVDEELAKAPAVTDTSAKGAADSATDSRKPAKLGGQ